ncbi:MAG: xanthine dehydrogenase family protein subunit M [Kiritimatiellia bacterium]
MKFCDFIIPHTVEEACGVLRQLGEAAQPIAGGTAFHFYTDDRIETAVDISQLGLNTITPVDGGFRIGAMTTLAQISDFKADGWMLGEVARHISTQQIRNISTIGGNISRVFPWSDFAIALQALGATMHVQGDAAQDISSDDFFKSQPARLFKDGSLLTGVTVPAVKKPAGFGWRKEQRSMKGFGLMSSGVMLTLGGNAIADIRVAIGAGIPFPRRLPKVEAALKGKSADEKTLGDIILSRPEEVNWVSKEGLSEEYIGHLADVVIFDALMQAVRRAKGEQNA